MREASDGEVKTLQKEVVQRRTSADPTLIPPAAESKLRQNIVNEYQKKLDIETDKSNKNQDSIQKKYSEQYQNALENFGDQQTRTNQAHNIELNNERVQFVDTVTDAESTAKNQAAQTEQINDKQRDHMNRQFAHQLDRQKRDYETMMEYSRTDMENRLTASRQDLTNQSKTIQRTLINHQNELIRDYEKKLSDQKVDYDSRIDDLKAQSRVDMRDGERRSKQDLELQARSYEQRIIQLETQFKERERSSAQNHQEELDRTRRSYELASKKKS